MFDSFEGPRWPRGKAPTLGPEGPRSETRFRRRSAVYWDRDTPNNTQGAKRPPRRCVAESWRGMPAQVPSQSSGRGSKLRDPSQNTPRVASKRDVNITKQILLKPYF
ncbi:hypothetical protein AVEN_101084-1 [Araneus ventricosus]|uniref:Uncharacterized protein n=1 Tax=Araneus ventricosus TaxID=182803 RepID=A0A4Y2MR64_ARAVE|nr:hypothetical protein AVEN_101084-1 [Araneus ventricosus]